MQKSVEYKKEWRVFWTRAKSYVFLMHHASLLLASSDLTDLSSIRIYTLDNAYLGIFALKVRDVYDFHF